MAGKGRPKGQPKTGGRAKGTTNKHTADLKAMTFAALNAGGGGQAWLERQRDENPVAFMNLLSKFIPRDLNIGGQDDNPIRTIHRIELIPLTGEPMPRLVDDSTDSPTE